MTHLYDTNEETFVTSELMNSMIDICKACWIFDIPSIKTQYDVHDALWLSPAKAIIYPMLNTFYPKKIPGRSRNEYKIRVQETWPMIYSLKWSNVSDVSGFHQNSTHCMFAKWKVTHKNEDLVFFMKVAPREKVIAGKIDNPMVDSINGKILRKITQSIPNSSVRRGMIAHTIMYETSFNCIIKNEGSSNKVVVPLHKMVADLNSVENPLSNTFDPNQEFLFASVFEYIPGESVTDLLENDPNGIQKLLNSLPDFWKTMGVLGMDYGMLHNDLHSGNVFYNTRTQKLMLIDYGQMTFPDDIQGVIRSSFNDIAETETLHNNVNTLTYHFLIQSRTVAYRENSHFYTTHLLDMATFMTNVYHSMYKHLDKQWLFFNDLISFDADGINIKFNLSITSCIIEWYRASMAVNNAEFLSPTEKRGMLLIGEGLFFMCMCMIHILAGKGLLTRGILTLNISRRDLANVKIMHYGFQIHPLVIHQYINTTRICESVLHELANMRNNAHLIAYMFNNSIMLQKMKTRNPQHGQAGGNSEMSPGSDEPSVKEWLQRYKNLTKSDLEDDASLESLARKDRDNVSILPKDRKHPPRTARATHSTHNATHVNSVLRESFARTPVLAHGGKKKKNDK